MFLLIVHFLDHCTNVLSIGILSLELISVVTFFLNNNKNTSVFCYTIYFITVSIATCTLRSASPKTNETNGPQ